MLPFHIFLRALSSSSSPLLLSNFLPAQRRLRLRRRRVLGRLRGAPPQRRVPDRPRRDAVAYGPRRVPKTNTAASGMIIITIRASSSSSQLIMPSLHGLSPRRLGYFLLAWLVVQAVAGVLKIRTLVALGSKIFTWHGDSGMALLLSGYVVATLGFWLRFNYNNQGGWSLGLRLALPVSLSREERHRCCIAEPICRRPALSPSSSSASSRCPRARRTSQGEARARSRHQQRPPASPNGSVGAGAGG